MKTTIRLCIGLFMLISGLLSLIPTASAQSVAVPWRPGFVIRAEDRFDPAIQRLMAEHSLRLLPLERGQLFYLYPIGIEPRLEGMQIRYLETLLEKRAESESAETEKESNDE